MLFLHPYKIMFVLKGYASTYNVDISNSFNPKLQLKDTKSTIKNQLIELLTQLKGFNFVTTLVLVFKKIKVKQSITLFIQIHIQK